MMTTVNMANLISALFGVVGTIVMFVGSYALQPSQGATFGSDAVTAANKEIRRKNKNRVVLQRTGLGLLCISFLIQIFAALQ
jgi:hypothetical protein